MARIVSVTFETTTQGRPGAFTIPRAAANVLGLGAEDPVELRIVWEGRRLELATQLRSGWEVYPRSSDATTRGLDAIPPRTPVQVTVWRSGEANAESPPEPTDWAEWTDERFNEAFEESGGSAEFLARVRQWALENEVSPRYGSGRSEGPLHLDAGMRTGPVTLISLGASGGIEWVFKNNLDRAPGLAGRPARVDLVRRIRDLFKSERPDERADTWLSAPSGSLSEADYPEFLAILDHELAATRQDPSDLRSQYHRLFTAVLERFKTVRPGVTSTQRVGTDNWLQFSAGRTGFSFSWSTAHQKYFRAELYIDVGDQAENKRLFDALRAQEAQLESGVGQPIVWERLDTKRASRLSVYYDGLTKDFASDQALIEWAAQTMARMVDVLRPIVRSL